MFYKSIALTFFALLMISETSQTMQNIENEEEIDESIKSFHLYISNYHHKKQSKDLRKAVMNDDVEKVTSCLNTVDVDPNYRKNELEWTSLMWACCIEKPDKNIIALLLTHKADANLQDSNGYTALGIACDMKAIEREILDIKILELLFEHKADPNLVNTSHETPLHHLCYYPNRRIIDLFLDSKADPNIQDDRGQTPLHIVAQNVIRSINNRLVSINFDNPEIFEIVKLFLKYDADYHIKDKEGKTPLNDKQLVKLGLYQHPQEIDEELQSYDIQQPKTFCPSIFHTDSVKQWCASNTICPLWSNYSTLALKSSNG